MQSGRSRRAGSLTVVSSTKGYQVNVESVESDSDKVTGRDMVHGARRFDASWSGHRLIFIHVM